MILDGIQKMKSKVITASWFMLPIMAVLMTGCGDSDGNRNRLSRSGKNVTITGTVEVSKQYSPIQGAECRFVELQGDEISTAFADADGQYTLEVPVDVEGEILCLPIGYTSLALSAYCSTRGRSSGDRMERQNVTNLSNIAAMIVASEAPADPIARSSELLDRLSKGQDNDLNLVAELSEKLFMAMLHNDLDIGFSGGDGSQSLVDGGGICGQVNTGLAASPLSTARCEFIAVDDLGSDRSALYHGALADFWGDGRLSRPDLQGIHQQINDTYDGHQQEIVDALKRVFPNGVGQPYVGTTDAVGDYFLAIPPDIPGYVCCTPPDQARMMLATYVPGRSKNEILSGQDVTPATTVHAFQIASRLLSDTWYAPLDIPATKENFIQNIAGLEIEMLQNGGAVAGFELKPGMTPANREVGLGAFSATALFNTLYQNQLNVDFPAVLENFFQEQRLTTESLTAQGVEADTAQACSAIVADAIAHAEADLDTQMSQALSTAQINVTVLEKPGGPPVSGVEVTTSSGSSRCIGCNTVTDDQGRVTLFLQALPNELEDIGLKFRSVLATRFFWITPLANVDIEVYLTPSAFELKISGNENFYAWQMEDHFEADGSGVVTSHDGLIECEISEGSGFFYDSTNNCYEHVASNTPIILTALPSASSDFVRWQGSACSGTNPTCQVTMDKEQKIVALFTPKCEEKLYRVWPVYRSFAASENAFSITTNYPHSCGQMSAAPHADWISIVEYEDWDNTYFEISENLEDGPRTANFFYGGHLVTIAQDGLQCTIADYGINPVTTRFESVGGTGTIDVRAQATCPWQAAVEDDWITITSSATGSGNGRVTYSVAENTGTPRGGYITIAGTQHLVVQTDAAANAMPALTIQNTGGGSGTVGCFQHYRFKGQKNSLEKDFACNFKDGYASGKCNMLYAPDTEITLQAWGDMDSSSIFYNWAGSCSGTYDECILNMDRMHTATARFVVSDQADLAIRTFRTSDPYLPVGTPLCFSTMKDGYFASNYLYCPFHTEFNIENRGVEDAQDFSIGFYISIDANISTNDTLLAHGRLIVPGLKAEEQFSFITVSENDRKMWAPADFPLGPAYLGILIDEFNEVEEDNEINNSYSIPIYLVDDLDAYHLRSTDLINKDN